MIDALRAAMDALEARGPARAAVRAVLAAVGPLSVYAHEPDLVARAASFLEAIEPRLAAPHLVIGPPLAPYMRRWHLVPRTAEHNVYLHQFVGDDDPRALHDHPWRSVSLMLRGRAREVLQGGDVRELVAGDIVFRQPTHRHRMELVGGEPAWTLFITGPAERSWGFWCPQGFVHWKRFVDPTNHGVTGRGCA